jgi:hypothetical protein
MRPPTVTAVAGDLVVADTRGVGRARGDLVGDQLALDAPFGPQRAVGNRAVTRLVQRQPTGTTGQPVGDAVRPEVEGYLTAFAAASSNQDKN